MYAYLRMLFGLCNASRLFREYKLKFSGESLQTQLVQFVILVVIEMGGGKSRKQRQQVTKIQYLASINVIEPYLGKIYTSLFG